MPFGPWPDRITARRFLTGLADAEAEVADPPATEAAAAAIAQWLKEHGLAPLAYSWCRSHPTWHPLLPHLAPTYYDNRSMTVLRHTSLQQIVTHLAQQAVPAILLKGGALSLTVYPDPSLRPMGDLDFWIQRPMLPRAWQVAEANGYHTKAIWSSVESIPERLTQMDFYTTAPEMCLEWHWDLISRPQLIGQLPLAAWWERVRSHTWQGQTVQMLDPAAALIHLCVHQMYQHWGDIRFIWLYDLDRLIRGVPAYHLTPADWARVRQESLQAGVLPGVQKALAAAAAWFNTPLPAEAQALLAENPPAEQQRRFQELVISGVSTAAKSWHELFEQPTWHERLAIMLMKLFPPPAYMRARYKIRGRGVLLFYYPYRWLKMIRIILTGKR